MAAVRSLTCVRAREWVSLELDGEVSQFERALVSSHLRRCGECSAFAEQVRGVTGALRSTPLEPLPTPLAVPTRRRGQLVRALPAMTAAAAAVLAALVLVHEPVTHGYRAERTLVGAPLVRSASVNDLVYAVRRRDLERGQLPVVADTVDGLGAVKPLLPASAA